jgi:hypothetical protein
VHCGRGSSLVGNRFPKRSRLEEVRLRAQSHGGPEGERLEAQASARLREIEQRIADLRASLQ